jgi:apoptosis-inducing factor 2
MARKTVVILGAGWAGLPLAHKLLKYTTPKLKSQGGLKVILVSPNSHFYWNVAAVRGVVPGAYKDDQLFLPIKPAFAQHPADEFEFVLGRAVDIDTSNNQVIVQLVAGSGARAGSASTSVLQYDHLVIATGSRLQADLPLKAIGSHEETVQSLHSLQKAIGGAKSIVIAGGGPTSVETAGEIAATYGQQKQVTLVVGASQVLAASNVLPSVTKTVERDLEKLGVKILRDARVVASKPSTADGKMLYDGHPGPFTVTLSTGASLTADVYIPLFGIKLNTDFVPEKLRDSSGSVVQDKTMRVVNTENIWAIGDAGSVEAKQLTVTDAQIIHLSKALDTVLTASSIPTVPEHKPSSTSMIFITLGKKFATGQIGGWKLWRWMVSYVKGRQIFVDTAPGYVAGKHLRHSAM